jgi:very-short-patch-repair endonuclease
MRDVKPIPAELLTGPFLRSRARKLGVTPKMLRGRRFERLHYEVYRAVATPLTHADRIAAARLALPEGAYLTGISRIRELGLEYGPALPIRFVVEGDHHLAMDGVFLHRTKALAPIVDGQLAVEAAFISYCSLARVIDAIKVGDWLLHNKHMTLARLIEIAGAHLWRAGAHEALFIANHLTARSRSLRESETAACLEFAGLPRPEFNLTLEISGREVIGDLVYRDLRLVIEYEGTHHQEDREQYNGDIDRYKAMRDNGYRYLQITKERIARPQRMVLGIHEEMVKAGYDGPTPVFGEQWRVLFVRVSKIVGRRGPDADVA